MKRNPVLGHSFNRQQTLIYILRQRRLGANPVPTFPLFLSNRTSVYLVAEMWPAEAHLPVSLASVGGDGTLYGQWKFNRSCCGNLLGKLFGETHSLPFGLPSFPTRGTDAASEGLGPLCHHERDRTCGQAGQQERTEDPGFPRTS